MELNYITTNEYKFKLASKLVNELTQGAVILRQCAIETPEIQSNSVEEISRSSALWAVNQTNTPVVTMDVGFHIEALKGFPGPYIKYINEWLSPEDILNILQPKSNKASYFIDALTYATPNGICKTFTAKTNGVITDKNYATTSKWTIDAIFIPNGYDVPIAAMTETERSLVWETEKAWKSLLAFVTDLQNKSDETVERT